MNAAPTVKRIVCLANSRKNGGRCIAGKELSSGGQPGGWIRPIGAAPGGEVRERERQYEDGSEPELLDVIEIRFINAAPKEYQSENWLIDAEYRWVKVGRLNADDLYLWLDSDEPLWSNDGANNHRMPVWEADKWNVSMRLIRVKDVHIHVQPPRQYSGASNVDAEFYYLGERYFLRITNPEFEREARRFAYDKRPMRAAFLTICLTNPFKGSSEKSMVYKVISAVIEH